MSAARCFRPLCLQLGLGLPGQLRQHVNHTLPNGYSACLTPHCCNHLRPVSLLLLIHSITQRHAPAGSLAPLEDSQTALTNLGQALAQAPAIQLAPSYVVVPAEFLRSAVQDAFKYQITQLGFADKVHSAQCFYMISCFCRTWAISFTLPCRLPPELRHMLFGSCCLHTLSSVFMRHVLVYQSNPVDA